MKLLSALVVAAAAIVGPGLAAADSYPSRQVTIVVPFPPGGVVDIYARLIAQKMQEQYGNPVIVENKAGATALIGTSYVAEAAADGHTLLFTASTHVTAAVSRENPPFDPIADFTPIVTAVEYPFYMVGTPSIPAETLADFIEYGKANPGELNFGTLGEGSGGHLLGETFAHLTGIDAVHVPFKGTGEILLALQASDVHFAFDSVPSAQPLVAEGKLRGYAVTAPERFENVPDVPTMAEAGVPDFVAMLWLGLLGPADLPQEVVEQLNATVNEALREDDFTQLIERNGYKLVGDTPAQFGERLGSDVTFWSQAVERAGVRLD